MSYKYSKTIICLANSRKISGRCIAGKVVADGKIGEWIRPISRRTAGELSEEERRFMDAQDPKLLDVIEIPMAEAQPHGFQVENHVIDDGYYWTRERVATADELLAAIDTVKGALWENSSSSREGINDRIEEARAATFGGSLKLIEVADLEIIVGIEGAGSGYAKRKIRGKFTLNGLQYLLAITDPVVERKYLPGADGTFKVGKAVLCISLGDVFKGHAYKLIAAVINPPAA